MRTIIYARFSSTLQNARSVQDQITLCMERCQREGWDVVGVYSDEAISGAAGIGPDARPGLHALLTHVERGGVDQVLAEATDRIARHQGDAFAVRERIKFHGARMFTLSDGVVTDITATFRGLVDAQFRIDMGKKVKRGQRGTVKSGRAPAGIAYGYKRANRINDDGEIIRGLRAIDPITSEIVRRIFDEFANGRSTRQIANDLNAEGIPSPRGRTWNASTIHGDRQRKDGILQNRLYVGELVHERTTKVVDPTTRRTLIRPIPESQWVVQPVPELAIIDRDLWDRVQLRRNAPSLKGPQLHANRRPTHLLSGLVRCRCGGGYTIKTKDRWTCNRRREGGDAACSNHKSCSTAELEGRVLSGLKTQLLTPEAVEIYVSEYTTEFAVVQRQQRGKIDELRRAQRDETTKVDRLVAALAEGGSEFAEIRDALANARTRRDDLAAKIAAIEADNVVALHPQLAKQYRDMIENLHDVLRSPDAQTAVPIIRSLIDRIEISPDENAANGLKIEIHGQINALLGMVDGPKTATVERVNPLGQYSRIVTICA